MSYPAKLRRLSFVLWALCFLLISTVAQALPTIIDSDIIIRLGGASRVGGGSYSTFAAEGWLHLALENGSQVKYTGTFTDNLDGGTSYVAKADATAPNAPVLQVFTRFGKFVFKMSSTFGSGSYFSAETRKVPNAFASATDSYLFGTTHGYTTLTYALYLDIVVGIPSNKASTANMTLTLLRDRNLFIVPRDPVTRTVSSVTIPTNPQPIFSRITAPGYFGTIYSNGSAADGLNLIVPYFGRTVALSGLRNGNDDSFFSGSAMISGARTAGAIGTFTASLQQPQ